MFSPAEPSVLFLVRICLVIIFYTIHMLYMISMVRHVLWIMYIFD